MIKKENRNDRSDSDGPAVGYRKPPREHQFPKGQSGNLKGRPKGTKDIKGLLRARLLATVTVRVNGKVRTMTALEAVCVRAVNDALQGRLKALIGVAKFLKDAGLFSLEEEPGQPVPPLSRMTIRIIRPEPRSMDLSPQLDTDQPHSAKRRTT